jgi:hypothetical protein
MIIAVGWLRLINYSCWLVSGEWGEWSFDKEASCLQCPTLLQSIVLSHDPETMYLLSLIDRIDEEASCLHSPHSSHSPTASFTYPTEPA